MGEKTNQLLADSRLAFLNQQNGKALNLALEAKQSGDGSLID